MQKMNCGVCVGRMRRLPCKFELMVYEWRQVEATLCVGTEAVMRKSFNLLEKRSSQRVTTQIDDCSFNNAHGA